MRWIAGLLVILLGTGAAGAEPDARAARLDAFFRAQAEAGGFNGNVLVAEKGRVVYQNSFGYADFETKRPNGPETEFELASVAKVFTAIAVLQLAERGRLSLDEPYAKYVPAFPYPAITPRQLLSHTSGMKEFPAAMAAYEKACGHPLALRDQVPALAAAHEALPLRPGERWWYSNQGYILLAWLVETVSGQRFDAYLQNHVLDPAGLRHTYLKTAAINPVDTPAFAHNYAFPFRFSSRRIRLQGDRGYYNGYLYGASNVVSTTGDLLKLDAALNEGRLLRPGTLEMAYAPAKLADGRPDFVWANLGGMGDADDGLGWFIFRDASDGRTVWHTGGMPGCVTLFLRNLTRGQTVILLDNAESAAFYRKGLSALRILNGKPPLEVPEPLARRYGRALMDRGPEAAFVALMEGREDPARFTLSENDLNRMAYEMLEQGHLPQALETFRTALWLFPQSDNAWESYAEALEKAQDRAGALAMYRKALRINPDNGDARAALARLEAPARP